MMKKIMICALIAFCINAAVYGRAVRDANGVYTYNRSGDPTIYPWNTINDWVKIGNTTYADANYAGQTYANYISLWSNTEVTEDAITNPNTDPPSPTWDAGFEPRCDLIMYADQGVSGQAYWVPVDTWCGYKWTVPDGNERIVSIQIAGFSNFAPVFQDLRVLDDSNNIIGNFTANWYTSETQWFHTHPDYDSTGHYYYKSSLPKTPVVQFPVNGSKSVKLIYYMRGNWWPYPQQQSSTWDHKAWTDNFFWIYIPRIRTIVLPKCGAENNPRPEGDINGDCKVDFADFAQLALNWTINNQFTGSVPTLDTDQQCGGGYDHLYPRLRLAGDINSDCVINLKDVQKFVATWLGQ